MDVDIQIDTKQLEKQLKRLEKVKNGGVKATTRALNYAVRGMKTEAKKGIKREYTVKKISDAASSIVVTRASYSNMSAAMTSKNRPIALTKFSYKKNPRPGIKGTPTVFASPKKGGGGYTGGFYAVVGSHAGAFRRAGRSRRPIDQLFGPSGTEMLNNKSVKDAIEQTAAERFGKEFDRQVELLLKG